MSVRVPFLSHFWLLSIQLAGYISKEMIKCSYSPDVKEMPNCMNSICICSTVFLCKKALQRFFCKYVAIVKMKLKKRDILLLQQLFSKHIKSLPIDLHIRFSQDIWVSKHSYIYMYKVFKQSDIEWLILNVKRHFLCLLRA